MAAALSGGLIALLIVAAMAKSVLYPLHTWIPEAMNAPTPVSALLHSACYVKAGVYLIARMYSIGAMACGVRGRAAADRLRHHVGRRGVRRWRRPTSRSCSRSPR